MYLVTYTFHPDHARAFLWDLDAKAEDANTYRTKETSLLDVINYVQGFNGAIKSVLIEPISDDPCVSTQSYTLPEVYLVTKSTGQSVVSMIGKSFRGLAVACRGVVSSLAGTE